jgi:aspartate aminotransferase
VSLCEFLLHRAKVACVPGAGFGTCEHVRLSYATAMEDIEKAMDRMAEALGELG